MESLFKRITYQKSRVNPMFFNGRERLRVSARGKQRVFSTLNQKVITFLQGFHPEPRITGVRQGKEVQGVI